MQSNSPRQLAGMLALAALLALGLAGCGGDEPAPVTAPAPAPAPAPPPFEPQSVEVALGSSGENVTLMTTEGGGFTLNGETVASGAEVMTEGGATYTLTLADGAWSAAFMPMAIEIPLGMSGDSVTVMTAEGGGVTLDGEPVTAGTRVMADNGATYQAGALPDGTLGAVYVPDTATVALGMHGGSVTLSLQEDRATWTDAGGAAVASGTMVMGNGRSYTLTLDGMEWSAAYDAVTATVALGASGASAVLTQTEDGSWWLGGAVFASGGTTTAGANAYVLTLADGAWSAAFMPMPIEIPLGMSGDSVTVMTAEGGGVTLDGEPVTADTRVMADNGATYQARALLDGTLGAVYVPDTATVALGLYGGSVTLSLQEDRATWTDAAGAAVASGTMVMGNGRSYTLTLDGMEWSAAYDAVTATVALGASGASAVLTQAENGLWWLGDAVFESGWTTTAGGNAYVLTLADGAWSAAFMPMAIEIPLGMSGDSVTVMTAEGGGVTLDGEPVTADTRVMADNGATYQARAPLPDGTLGAVYVPDTATVALGMHGGSVTLSLQEDRATWTDAGGAAVASGTMVMGNGRSYTLTLDGMEWSAAYNAVTATVALGSSGENVTLMTTEGGGFTLNGETVASGAEVMTEGGATYTLTLADGAWSAAFMPMAIEIPLGMSGDSVTVMTAEGGGVTLDGEPVTADTRVMADNGATYQAGPPCRTARWAPSTCPTRPRWPWACTAARSRCRCRRTAPPGRTPAAPPSRPARW